MLLICCALVSAEGTECVYSCLPKCMEQSLFGTGNKPQPPCLKTSESLVQFIVLSLLESKPVDCSVSLQLCQVSQRYMPTPGIEREFNP